MDKKKMLCMELIALTNLIKRKRDASSCKRNVDELTGTNGWVIAYLMHNTDHDVFQRDFEEAFSIRRSTVSKIIKSMENKDLIKRESVDYDARLKKIVLSSKGIEIQKMIDDDFEGICNQAFSNFTPDEIESLTEIIAKIKRNFE